MRRWMFILLICCCSNICAQEFRVASFSLLESDLTARVNPVFDLNGDACALIKVIGDSRFDFSGPLGIVKRTERTAEILLYVPAGTKQLTISHPSWGMLRNYALPMTLDGRDTYEMVLESLVVSQPEPVLVPDTLSETPVADTIQIETETEPIQAEPPMKVKKTYPSHWVILAQGGIGKTLSSGGMVAYLHKFGLYASFLSNWASVDSNGLECNGDGTLYSSKTTPYYSSTSKQTFYAVDAGATLLLARNMYLYGGAGYGAYQKYWETIEGETVRNKDLSAKGFLVSLGTIFCYKHFSAQIGVKSITFKNYSFTLGIGFSL